VAIALALEGVLAMSTFVIAARASASYTSDLMAVVVFRILRRSQLAPAVHLE